MRAAACLSLLLLCPHAAAERLSFTTPPLRLKGVQHAMIGPKAVQTVLFDEPGWIVSFDSFVTDERGRRRADQSAFCHTTFHYGRYDQPQHPRVTVDEGVHRIAFPKGFGFKVRPDAMYMLDMMLQSEDPDKDETLSVRTELDFRPERPGTALRSLTHYFIHVWPRGPQVRTLDSREWGVWWVPKGRHRYESVTPAPASGRVHFMTVHLHRGAAEYELADDASGRVLHRGVVRSDARGEIAEVPVYSSAEGFPLTAGQPVRLSVVYDNPSDKPLVAMATLHLFTELAGAEPSMLDDDPSRRPMLLGDP
jgi:hypothetical protein